MEFAMQKILFMLLVETLVNLLYQIVKNLISEKINGYKLQIYQKIALAVAWQPLIINLYLNLVGKLTHLLYQTQLINIIFRMTHGKL